MSNHISDISISTVSDNRLSGFKRILNKYQDLYYEYPQIYHYRLLSITGELMMAGRLRDAKDFYKKALKMKRISVNNILVPCKSVALRIRRNILKY